MNVIGLLFKAARLGLDARAIVKAVRTSDPIPLAKRAVNKQVGRKVVSRAWWR